MFVVQVSGVVCTPSGLRVGDDGSPSSDYLGHRWSFGDAGKGIELLTQVKFYTSLDYIPQFPISLVNLSFIFSHVIHSCFTRWNWNSLSVLHACRAL